MSPTLFELKTTLGQALSRRPSPRSYDLAARAGLVHALHYNDGVSRAQRFGSLDEVKAHLQKTTVAAERCVVFWVRHPATTYSEIGKAAGSAHDIGLSETGETQLPLLARALEGINFDRLYSSRLRRSIEAADFLAATLGLSRSELPGIEEIDYGNWSGKVLRREKGGDASIEATDPTGFRLFKEQPHLWNAPEAETFWQAKERIEAGVAKIDEQGLGKVVLVVGHGWSINSALASAYGVHIAHMKKFPLSAPTAINVIEYSRSQTDNRLWLWADSSHLPGQQTSVKEYG